MKHAAIIQARCDSTRLPGKVLMDLCGKPVLQRVIERVQRSKFVDEVVVATSMQKSNLPILRLCCDLGVRVFAGSEQDVLDRYYQTAKLVSAEYVTRITADCPCYDWKVLDSAIAGLNPGTQYLCDFDETLPDGLDIEIMTFSALRESWENARLVSEREHVTQYIRKNPERYTQQNFQCPIAGIGHFRLTLDEPADYDLIKALYDHFMALGNADFGIQDITDYLRQNPSVSAVNSQFSRNEGLAKSLQQDREID